MEQNNTLLMLVKGGNTYVRSKDKKQIRRILYLSLSKVLLEVVGN